MGVWKSKSRGWWVAKFQHQGERYKKEGFTTRRAAVLWEAKKRQEVNARPPKEIPMVSFQELATAYLDDIRPRMQLNTVRQKAFVYRSFIASLGADVPVAIITTKQISDYLNTRAVEDGSKTANRDLRDLKALYNWGLRQEVIEGRNPCNPIEKYPEEPYRPYVPAPEDIDKVRMAATADERGFLDVIYHLLARRSEVVRLTWEDVNLEERWVRLYTRKRRGGELQADYLPMNDTLHQVLLSRWKRRDKSSPRMFQFTQRHLRYMMGELCKRAKVKPFGFHAIRHHVSSVLNDSGKASMKQIQKLLRHRMQSTTENYLHSIEGNLYQAARILNGEVVHSGTPDEGRKSKKAQG
jgi:integrase